MSNVTKTHEKYKTYTEDQRDFFDELVTIDINSYFNNKAWDDIRNYEIDCIFKYIKPQRVIDVGCGIGFHDFLMANKIDVQEVVGIDYSAKSVEMANHYYPHKKIRRQVADIYEMEPKDFDMAVSFQVIEHLSEPAKFLKACVKLVKPGGWVVVITPNRGRLENRIRKIFSLSELKCDPQHFAEYRMEELAPIAKDAGLRLKFNFGYGLSLRVPKTHIMCVPKRLSLISGRLFPSIADCFCSIYALEDMP